MTTEWFKNKITEQIECGRGILCEFESLQMVTREKRPFFNNYDENKQSNLKSELYKWEHRVMDILKSHWGGSRQDLMDEFKISDPTRWGDFKDFGVAAVKNNITVLESYMDRMRTLGEDDNNTSISADTNIDKPYKVFISHSHKDKEFAEALVELLEFIGLGKDQLVCTSVPGYGIPSGKNIFDWLRDQFNEYRLFMIFIHSASYYESPVSLNEMGAAWVLKEDFHSFLVKDLDFKDMQGVIADEYASTKVDATEARGHLNELKDKLVKIFNLGGVDSTRWETKREDFLRKVTSLPAPKSSSSFKSKTEQAEFKVSYLPILSKFFDLLDVGNYTYWMYIWSFATGDPIIPLKRYENFSFAQDELNRINNKEGFDKINLLIKNLSLLMRDFRFVCDEHLWAMANGKDLTIERFYNNFSGTRRDEATLEYYELLKLIQDLSYELTRMLNLLLDDIREYVPDFLNEYGIMTVKDEKPEDVKYRKNEASLSPYPGLRQFAESTRFTRSKFIGKQGDIEYLRPILDTYKD